MRRPTDYHHALGLAYTTALCRHGINPLRPGVPLVQIFGDSPPRVLYWTHDTDLPSRVIVLDRDDAGPIKLVAGDGFAMAPTMRTAPKPIEPRRHSEAGVQAAWGVAITHGYVIDLKDPIGIAWAHQLSEALRDIYQQSDEVHSPDIPGDVAAVLQSITVIWDEWIRKSSAAANADILNRAFGEELDPKSPDLTAQVIGRPAPAHLTAISVEGLIYGE